MMVCQKCGHAHHPDLDCIVEVTDSVVQTTELDVSVVDDTLDLLVQKASTPSLAALIKAGKDRGLIKPQQGYTST